MVILRPPVRNLPSLAQPWGSWTEDTATTDSDRLATLLGQRGNEFSDRMTSYADRIEALGARTILTYRMPDFSVGHPGNPVLGPVPVLESPSLTVNAPSTRAGTAVVIVNYDVTDSTADNTAVRTGRQMLMVNGSPSNASAVSNPVMSDSVSSPGTYKSGYRWPDGSNGSVSPPISSSFGPRDGRLHAGTDFVGFSTVCAIGDGTVLGTGVLSGWTDGGQQVYIQHPSEGTDTITSRALHLVSGSILVSPGNVVYAGQPIGTMGATGNAQGVHLHQEVARNGGQIDPWTFITAHLGAISIPGTSTQIVLSPGYNPARSDMAIGYYGAGQPIQIQFGLRTFSTSAITAYFSNIKITVAFTESRQ